jgi:hypothetical protein
LSKIREWLEVDHRAIGALLDLSDADGSFDGEAFEKLRGRLLRHIGIEEKVLLRAVHETIGRPISRARRIRVEHGAIAALLVPTPDLALVSELRSLLRAHDTLEEGDEGVYAECDHILGPRADELVMKAEAFPVVPLARHFDGKNVPKTAEEALVGASRMKYLNDET